MVGILQGMARRFPVVRPGLVGAADVEKAMERKTSMM
jgi:hypothetical protein